jgi:hypothetical protein
MGTANNKIVNSSDNDQKVIIDLTRPPVEKMSEQEQ